MPAQRYKFFLLFLFIIVAVLLLFRWWRGPVLASYHLQTMPLVQNVVATGRVTNVARSEIGSEISGVVLERRVKEGDHVEAGDILLLLKSDELNAQLRQAELALEDLKLNRRPQAQAELASAQAQFDQARREANRRRQASLGILSAEEIEKALEAERVAANTLATALLKAKALQTGQSEEATLIEKRRVAQLQLEKSKIRATVAGTILSQAAEPGDVVQPGQSLFSVALNGRTEVRVPLDERNLSWLSLQQSALIIADAYPNQPFPAHIHFIAPGIDPQRGTVEVRLTVDPVPKFLRQDMTVSVNVETAKRAQALAIPNDALSQVKGDQATVLRIIDGKVQHKQITLGLRGTTHTEVRSGLSAGDNVLVNPEQDLAEGKRVRLKLQNNMRDQSQMNALGNMQ